MDPYELQRYISVYKSNPFLFDDDFVDEIEKASKELDIPFKRNISAEESKQDNILNQFTSGAVQGFTTLGWADEPTSGAGQIAHSMGFLVGFVPAIVAGLFTGGATALARVGVGAAQVGRGAKIVKGLSSAGRFLASDTAKSVPFRVGGALNKKLYSGLGKAGVSVDKYLKTGNVTADILTSAQELGAASAVSSVWEGPSEWMNSYVHGAIFGGAFGSIGNFTNIGKMMKHPNPSVRKGAEDFIWNKVVRTGLGSVLQGGIATAQGAPTSVQLYEYMLGGFFGYKHPNAKIKAARKYTEAFDNSESDLYGDALKGREREMISAEEYSALHPVSQDYVRNYFNKHIGERFESYNPQLELFPELEPDDPSIPSVLAKAHMLDLYKDMKLQDRRNELLEERKRDELSEDEEILARIRTMNDMDEMQNEIRTGEVAAEVTDKVRDEKLKISQEGNAVYNKLTTEQKKRVKEGDSEVILEVIRGGEDATVDVKEFRDLINMDRPVEDQLEVDAPNHIRDFLLEIEKTVGDTESSVEILENVVEVFNKSVKEKVSYDNFIKEIEDIYPKYVVSPSAKQKMRSVFNRMNTEKLYPYIYFDRLGNNLDYRTVYDPHGKRVADNRPPASDEVHFKAENVDKLAATAEGYQQQPTFKEWKANPTLYPNSRLSRGKKALEQQPELYEDLERYVKIGKQADKRMDDPSIPELPKADVEFYMNYFNNLTTEQMQDLGLIMSYKRRTHAQATGEPLKSEEIGIYRDIIQPMLKDNLAAEGGLVTLYRGVGGKSKDKYIQEGSYVGSGDVVTGFGERLSTTTDIDEAKHYGKEILTFEVPQSYIDKHGKLNKTHYYVDGKRVEGAEVSFPKGLPAKFAKEAPKKYLSQDNIKRAEDLSRSMSESEIIDKIESLRAVISIPSEARVDIDLEKKFEKQLTEERKEILIHELALHKKVQREGYGNILELSSSSMIAQNALGRIETPSIDISKLSLKELDRVLGDLKGSLPQREKSARQTAAADVVFARLSEVESYKRDIARIENFKAAVPPVAGKRITSVMKAPAQTGFKVFGPKFKIVEFKETKVGDTLYMPYDKRYDPELKKFVNVMAPKDWWNFTTKLDEKGQYSKIPRKDSGAERVYPYHPKTDLKKWETYVNSLKKIDPKARDHIREDFDNWAKFNFEDGFPNAEVGKKAWDIYRKMVMSNFLYEPYAQFKNANDRVKRESLLASKGMPQDQLDQFKDISPDGSIEFIVVDDMPSGLHKTNAKGVKHEKFYTTNDGKTISGEDYYGSEIDGYLVFHTDLYKKLLEVNGFDTSTSRLKPSIAAWIDGKLFLVKGGVHTPHTKYDTAMGAKNRGIVMISAAKIVPDKKNIYHAQGIKDKDGNVTYEFRKHGTNKKVKNPKTVKIKLEDLRIDYGVKEDSHALEPQSIKKPFHVLLNELQIPRESFDSLMDKVFAPNIEGVKEANEIVKALSVDKDTPIPRNFNIGDIGDAEFTYLINNSYHPLYERLLMHVVKETKYNEYIDSFGDEQSLIELTDYTTRLQRWAKYSDFNPIVSMIEPELYQSMILRYRKNKYMYPKWKYSAHSWVAGNDPVTKLIHGSVKNGTFKAGYSLRDMPIKWGETGKDSTLGELWDEYQKAKKQKSSNVEELEDYLEIALMRVPSPAVSGTRILRFDGFIENTEGVKDHGVYMHPKDHFYIDGADVDGDQVFIYQGLPKAFREAVKANRNENAIKIDGKWAQYPIKAEEFNELYGTGPIPPFMASKVSQYLPFALRKAGMSSYIGKKQMGAVVNAKTILNFMTADIIKNHDGKMKLDLVKGGKKYGTVYLETSEKQLDDSKGYRRQSAREATPRTADSSEFWEMLSPLEMREVLLKSSFSNIRAVDTKGKKFDFKYNDIINTSYGDLYEVNNKLFGKNWNSGKQWSISEVQQAMQNATSTEYRMNSLLWLSNKMASNNIDIRYIRGNKAWRNLINTWNEAWKDPNAKKYLIRKKLKITPVYLETNKKELQDRIDKLVDDNPDLTKAPMDIELLKVMGLRKDPTLDPRWQKLFDQAKEDGLVVPHEPLKEAKLLLNDALDLYSAIRISQKGEILYNAIIDAGGTEKEAMDFLGLLAEEATVTKINWRNSRMGNKGKFLPMKYVIFDVEKTMKEVKREIHEKAKELGILPKNALDYYHYYTMGTLYPQPYTSQQSKKIIRDWLKEETAKPAIEQNENMIDYYKDALDNWSKFYNKTSFNRFPMETREVPERIKKDFMAGFAKTWDIIRSDKPLGKTEILKGEELSPETVKPGEGITKSQKETEVKLVLERLFDDVFKGKKVEDIPADKIPEDIPRVLKKLVEDLKAMPQDAALRVEEGFIQYSLEAYGIGKKISNATYRDLRNFQRFISRMRIASATEPRVKKLYYYLFPERLGEKQLSYDMSQVYKKTVPYDAGKNKAGFIDVRLPFSSYQYLNESFNQIYNLENIDKEYSQEYIQRYYGWRDQILGKENGHTEFAQLHRAAISRKLKDSDVGKQGNAESKAKRREEYNKLWKENEPFYNELKDKIYKITEKGKTVEKTGEEVMDWIVEKHEGFFNNTYKKWVTSNIDWGKIDDNHVYGKKDELVEFTPSGRLKIEKIQKKLFDAASFGNQKQVRYLINNTSLSVDLLNRIQYEIGLEAQIAKKKLKPESKEAQKYRENNRKRFTIDKITGKEEWRPSAYTSIGEVKGFYWPHTNHRATRKSRREVQKFIGEQIALLKDEAGRYADDLLNGVVESTEKYKIKQRWMASKGIKNSRELFLRGKISKEEFVDRFVAKQEVDFEQFLGGRGLEDGGASETAIKWLLASKSERSMLDDIGFRDRPGTGKARGDTPMPGFSLDFDVAEYYSNQWVSSFYRNLTSLISHRTIERFTNKNVLLKGSDMQEWANFMKMYARDVMGYTSAFTSDIIGLQEPVLKRYQDFVERVDKKKKKGYVTGEELKEYDYVKEILKKDKRLKKIRKTAYFWLSDDNISSKLEWVAFKLGGKKTPKLPLLGELPKSPEARKRVLIDAAKKIGAFDAKWQLISLLSHPKTALGNLMGGNVNTISQNGLRHFTRTKDKAFLYNIFKGAKLQDGTEATPDNISVWLNRFAEESGAIESFIVSEAGLERGFRGKKVKGFLNEFVNELKKDYSMSDQSLVDLAKNHGINKAFVDGGAWFMRKSERSLRRDSFLAHYLNNYEILSDIIPNIKFDNPYLLRMATEGVRATQFLYHSSARPAFSRTTTGKILTRFMPFAWNSVRFRRLAYQRAATYNFDLNTIPGKRFQRILTLDAFTFALANIFVSSIFDSAMPPPMSYMQDTADWLFGDEKQRERAFFNQWPHPALAPLSTVTGPSLRFVLGPTKALINNDWEPFLNYQLWTWAPFGRFGRSLYRTAEVPEMWVEEMTGIPIHRASQMLKKARKEKEEEEELKNAA